MTKADKFLITVFFLVVAELVLCTCHYNKEVATEPQTVEEVVIEQSVEVEEKEVVEPSPSPETITCLVTAYCPCEICCGDWAKCRPLDENGEPIVYGASGNRLIPNYSVGVDPSIIPYGTIIRFGGREYRADDTGGLVQGNHIDVYHSTHEEALSFPMGEYEVEILN